MNRALVLALCAGLAMAPAAASGSETYRLCGPDATGFIRVGKSLACIKAPPQPAVQAKGKPQEVVKAGANRRIDEDLNRADLAFREGYRDIACGWVESAITSDNRNYGDIPSSKEQREQLKQYARRCNLRY